MEKIRLFYGNSSPFSNHYPVHFVLNGVRMNCSEQAMMYKKALLFSDGDIAGKIIRETNPVEHKRLGRLVKGFDDAVWNKHKLRIVYDITIQKFMQNPELLKQLLDTEGWILAEASPRDTTWGIGLGASNPKAFDRTAWRGKNLLGKILMLARDAIIENREALKIDEILKEVK